VITQLPGGVERWYTVREAASLCHRAEAPSEIFSRRTSCHDGSSGALAGTREGSPCAPRRPSSAASHPPPL